MPRTLVTRPIAESCDISFRFIFTLLTNKVENKKYFSPSHSHPPFDVHKLTKIEGGGKASLFMFQSFAEILSLNEDRFAYLPLVKRNTKKKY